jgi:CheY-like chemotaxis protein
VSIVQRKKIFIVRRKKPRQVFTSYWCAAPVEQRMARVCNNLIGRRVLIVEDDPLIVMLFEDTLTDMGCEIAGRAARLADGVAKARSLPLDIAIVDVNLNGQQSFAIAAALIEREIPLVFVTGYDLGSLPLPFIQVPLLTKPFRRGDLRNALLMALGIAHEAR